VAKKMMLLGSWRWDCQLVREEYFAGVVLFDEVEGVVASEKIVLERERMADICGVGEEESRE
jgi:hypothetical protein